MSTCGRSACAGSTTARTAETLTGPSTIRGGPVPPAPLPRRTRSSPPKRCPLPSNKTRPVSRSSPLGRGAPGEREGALPKVHTASVLGTQDRQGPRILRPLQEAHGRPVLAGSAAGVTVARERVREALRRGRKVARKLGAQPVQVGAPGVAFAGSFRRSGRDRDGGAAAASDEEDLAEGRQIRVVVPGRPGK